ncbi:uncharacterized protein E0L32_010878 [Thyridium curvatum]|uniref:Endonuclease/exonuclease/phosphatase domain-containing protein n=1 Tax=Thyridium curvatum TaxID=1093900 RepID=A0A507ADN6_9PEZI|nr:uncharacterized protein E0L32_010878 [Thyridium curvatum]TPX07175.1 hypothetical protein E0L32_010878 [Thyridium curvatum]
MSKRHSDISPPPLKRRKVAAVEQDASLGAEETPPRTKTQRGSSIRIYSWNINGIQPFVPQSSAPITAFFRPKGEAATSIVEGAATAGPASLRGWLARHDWPEVLFLQEVKINRTNNKLLSTLASSLNTPLNPQDNPHTDDRRYALHTTLPRDRFNARGFGGKLYGVATILRADFEKQHVGCVRDVPWDLEGRVSIVETTVSTQHGSGSYVATPEAGAGIPAHKPLAIVNVYAVNGTGATYRSSQDGHTVGTRHDHKLSFHSLLRDECLALEARGFDVIVAGDLNIARSRIDGYPNLRTSPVQHCYNRADFNRKFFGPSDNKRAGVHLDALTTADDAITKDEDTSGKCLNGVDIFRAIHGDRKQYTYHPRTRDWGSSCDRVDLIIVSQHLWRSGRVVGTGILDSPQERGPSDHVPLWVQVSMEDAG